jgi:hypothetical protein
VPEQRKYNLKIAIPGGNTLNIPCECGSMNWGMAILPVYMSCDKDHDHEASDEPVVGMRFLECRICGRSRVWMKDNNVTA